MDDVTHGRRLARSARSTVSLTALAGVGLTMLGIAMLGIAMIGCGPGTASDATLNSPIPGSTAGAAAPGAPPTAMNPLAPGGTTTPPVGVGPAAPVTPGAAGAAAPTLPAGPATPMGAAADELWCGVKRTLDSRCTACHNEQKTAGAPMSLKTHADMHVPAVSDPTKKVFQLVGTRVHDTVRPMPPQEQLTPEQLTGIDTWVAAGAPVGSDPLCAANGPVEMPTEVPWPDNCDETYTILAQRGSGKNTIRAGEESHPQFTITPPWGTEEVQAIAWRAITDNPKVLHHWILYGPQREFLFGWAPGKDQNEPLPPDVGIFLPQGTMNMDVHYNNLQGTSSEEDASGAEICVLKKPNFRPKTATVAQNLQSAVINIPPRGVDVKITGTCAHSGQPVRLLSASPHAHRTAKHMKFWVEKANGETVVMHDKAFNFEEQTVYQMNPPVIVESGDRIITECTYTNDTDSTITFGQNTNDEMCFNFALYEPMGGLNCGFGGLGGFPGAGGR